MRKSAAFALIAALLAGYFMRELVNEECAARLGGRP